MDIKKKKLAFQRKGKKKEKIGKLHEMT